VRAREELEVHAGTRLPRFACIPCEYCHDSWGCSYQSKFETAPDVDMSRQGRWSSVNALARMYRYYQPSYRYRDDVLMIR